MIIKRLVLYTFFLVVCFAAVNGYAADTTNLMRKNILFVTVGGKENRGSVNYERIIAARKKWYYSISAGVQPFSLPGSFSLPVSLNVFTRPSQHRLEFNLAATFYMDKFHPFNGGYQDDYNKQLYVSPMVGYRLQPLGRFMLKVGVGPRFLIDPPSDNIVQLRTRSVGAAVSGSVGYCF
jgi:hypothetical protein